MNFIKKKNNEPVIMGILNITPDSFSDGMPNGTPDDFLKKAEILIQDGADILDIGAESTRPGAELVSLKEEKDRIIGFLKVFRKKFPDFPVSLDTRKYEVALATLPYKIQMINDTSFLSDIRLVELAKQEDLYYVLMHSRGKPSNMMNLTSYPSGVVNTIHEEFQRKIRLLKKINFSSDKLLIDLGFGFAKTEKQCVELINNLSFWNEKYRSQLLFAVSRKRFLQEYTGKNNPIERDLKSAELAKQAYDNGFKIFRVHNIQATKNVFGLSE